MTTDHVELHTTAPTQSQAGSCQCGNHEEGPVALDVRQIPHAIRHATVFGALGAITPGMSLDLVAPHDPVPLLVQIHDRFPGQFAVTYVDSGPVAWKVRFSLQ